MKSKRPRPLMFTNLSGTEEPRALDSAPEAAETAVARAQVLAARSPDPVTADFDMRPTPRSTPASSRPAGAPRTNELGFARYAYAVAVLAALVWAGGLVAFVAGFQTHFGAFDYTPLQWGVIGLLAVLPALFMLLAAFALRQGASLAAETRRARALADDLAIPAALATDQVGGAMEAMRREIEKATEAARAARAPMVTLRETLAVESQRLFAAAAEAQATGRLLTEALGRERVAMGEVSQALHLQSADAAEALARQARMVADASDLAQAQLDEAQAALTARAADLAIAAGDARHAAESAGETLSNQIDKLESAGAALGDRLSGLAGDLSRERQGMAGVAEILRTDQEDLAYRLEAQRGLLAEAAANAREGAAALNLASTDGADALRSLIATAAIEVRRLAETAHREQETLDAQARASLGLFSGAVAEERAAIEAQTRAAIGDLAAAAEEARTAAASHVEYAAEAVHAHTEAARAGLNQVADDVAAKIDSLGEAAFAASQRADQVFDGRIAAARRMIEQSAALVEETGERSAQRIEAGLIHTRAAMADMDTLLTELDRRMESLPQAARLQAAEVRKAIEQGVGDLTQAARRAAEETQAIDSAFQERVRRNYEILSDAMRLMGRVAGAADLVRPAAPAPAPGPAHAPAPIKQAAPVIRPAANGATHQDIYREPAREGVREAMPELRAAVAGDRVARAPISDAGASARYVPSPPPEPMRPAALSDGFNPETPPRRPEPVSAASAGLRPRLKLTAMPLDEPAPRPRPPVPPAPAPAAPIEVEARLGDDEWTWKDLLSSMDESASDDDSLAERLIAEIEALGVDTAALLTRPRIDEIAAALQTGDAGGAREVVRRLAPSAVRRLSRRVLTDKVLRAQADRYVRRYEELISDSAQRDREGYMTAALLGSDPGRAFLLLDAAVGDLH